MEGKRLWPRQSRKTPRAQLKRMVDLPTSLRNKLASMAERAVRVAETRSAYLHPDWNREGLLQHAGVERKDGRTVRQARTTYFVSTSATERERNPRKSDARNHRRRDLTRRPGCLLFGADVVIKVKPCSTGFAEMSRTHSNSCGLHNNRRTLLSEFQRMNRRRIANATSPFVLGLRDLLLMSFAAQQELANRGLFIVITADGVREQVSITAANGTGSQVHRGCD
jgi:hypothetical protein